MLLHVAALRFISDSDSIVYGVQVRPTIAPPRALEKFLLTPGQIDEESQMAGYGSWDCAVASFVCICPSSRLKQSTSTVGYMYVALSTTSTDRAQHGDNRPLSAKHSMPPRPISPTTYPAMKLPDHRRPWVHR